MLSAIAAAIDSLLADPARAADICGAIANPATLARVEAARDLGKILRDSAPLDRGRSATPLLVAVDAADEPAYAEERFGPIAFVVAVEDARDGIARAAQLARVKGVPSQQPSMTPMRRAFARRPTPLRRRVPTCRST